MKKSKKLILSLTISLLSFAGVGAMTKPIPKITNYRELGSLINQYPTSDFLTNKSLFADKAGNKIGILEVLLNAYNDLPAGAKNLAENLFQSKFRLSSKQLSDKLSAIDQAKAIPVTVAQAQRVINLISSDKSALRAETADLTAKIDALESGLSGFKGKSGADFAKLEEQRSAIEITANRLNDTLLKLRDDQSALEKELAALKAMSGTDKSEITKIEGQLKEAAETLAKTQKEKDDFEKKSADLEKKLKALKAKMPKALQAQAILENYDDLNGLYKAAYAKYNVSSLDIHGTPINIDDDSAIKAINDIPLLNGLSTSLEENTEEVRQALLDYNDQSGQLYNDWNELNDKTKQADFKKKTDAMDQEADKLDKLLTKFTDLEKYVSDKTIQLEKNSSVKALLEKFKSLRQRAKDIISEIVEQELFPPETNVGKTLDDLAILDQFADKSELLKEAAEKINLLIQNVNGQKNILSNSFAVLEKEVQKLITSNITTNQTDELTAGKVLVTDALDIHKTLTARLSALKDAINEKIKLIPAKNPQEEAIIKDIKDFLNDNLVSDEIEKLSTAEETFVESIKSDDLAKLKANLGLSESAFANSTKAINAYTELEKKAASYPAAQKLLQDAAERLAQTKKLITQAGANITALKKEIQDKEGNGNTEPANDTVSDVTVDLSKYTVNFKIGNIAFKSDANIDDDLQFLTNIIEPNITEVALSQAGQELAKKAKTPQDLRTIVNDILRAEYDRATTNEQKNRIVNLIKPILIAYKNSPIPEGKDADYWTSMKAYTLILKGLFGSNLPAELQ